MVVLHLMIFSCVLVALKSRHQTVPDDFFSAVNDNNLVQQSHDHICCRKLWRHVTETEATNDQKLPATILSTVELLSLACYCHQISNSYPFDCELEHVQLLCVLFFVITYEMKHKTYLFLRDEWFKDKTETDWIANQLRRIIPGPRHNFWYVDLLRLCCFRAKP